jgi:ribose transport system substrate-binding protein
MRIAPRSVTAPMLLVVLVLNLVLTGCGDQHKGGSPGERNTIGLVVSKTSSDFAREMGEGYRAGAQGIGGVQVMVTGPATDNGPDQVQRFEELTRGAKGGIAVAPSAPELFARPMAETQAGGTPVITVGGRPAPGSDVRLLVSNDSYGLGETLAEETVKRLPPDCACKIIIGSSSPSHPGLDQRAAGTRDALTRRLPKAQVLGPLDTQLEDSANLAAWRVLVNANPDAVAFLGTADIDAYNLAAIRAETRSRWLAGGFGVDRRTLQAIKDGQLFAAVSPEHFLNTAVAGRLMAEHARGARPLPEGWLVTPGLVVDPANVDDIIRRQSSEAGKLAWTKPQLENIISNQDRFLRPLDQAR